MGKKKEACLVCGEELIYFENGRKMECVYCHKTFMSNASCENGHYVCDKCHGAKAVETIKKMCLETDSENPAEIALAMMKNPFIHMHGPEHHVLVGAALLAAYRNAGGEVDIQPALEELAKRGSRVPGGICGFWGSCGAGIGTGIFISIVTGSTPLAAEAFGLCNKMTSASLNAIGEIGGPRCCKRNVFLAIQQAVVFCKKHLGVEMKLPETYICQFADQNRQCIGKRCPFSKFHE